MGASTATESSARSPSTLPLSIASHAAIRRSQGLEIIKAPEDCANTSKIHTQ